MTKIVIEIEKESLDWWRGMVERSLENSNAPSTIAAFHHLTAWQVALDAATVQREVSDTPAAPRKRRRKNAAKPKVDKSGLSCHIHTTYGGIRVPRTDCEFCWTVYGKMHPMELKKQRAAFERKQRQQQS